MKYNYNTIKLLSYFSIGVAAFNTVLNSAAINHESIYQTTHPFDSGVTLANAATALIGTIAYVVAKCLERVEERLDRIEGKGIEQDK